ncbi:MAG: GNAT family N-acetyltransferase [Burkholderiales bacterium]
MSDARVMAGVDLRRVEEVGLNALQTQRQLFYDGWLLRISPGKARRARSVNAHFGSTLPLADKIAYCERLYREHHLPVLFRMTPFVQPAGLADALAARGYEAFDPTLVQVASLDRPPDARECDGVAIASAPAAAFADAVALLQDATPAQRDAYYERMAATPQQTRALVAHADGEPVGVGTAMLEDGIAGLFSMATAPAMRGRGVASALVARLLAWAWERGARVAYLQVDAQNVPALAVYRKFGFATAYTYHYCAVPGEAR